MKLNNRIKQLQIKLGFCPVCGRRQSQETVIKVLRLGEQPPAPHEGCPICDRVVVIRVSRVDREPSGLKDGSHGH